MAGRRFGTTTLTPHQQEAYIAGVGILIAPAFAFTLRAVSARAPIAMDRAAT